MKCEKCGYKHIVPFGSPSERRKHPEYTLYACPKCGNPSAVIHLRKISKQKSAKAGR